MQTIIQSTIKSIDHAPPVRFRGLTLLPISVPAAGPLFITLGQALASGTMKVTEIGAGSVPQLMVTNLGDAAVLILDGEELRGAKQNRVLNTTVLVAPHSKLVVPVSCTEHGRWHGTSDEFADSGNVMPVELRRSKVERVHESLAEQRGFAGDQGRVWSDIGMFLHDVGVNSSTSALADGYESHRATLDDYLAALPAAPGQCGMLVLVNGRVAGLDLVSQPDVYASLHARLLRSYTGMVLGRRAQKDKPAEIANDLVVTRARRFLDELADADAEPFPSVGAGQDVRLKGGPVVGTALVVEATALHLAGFPRAARGREPRPPFMFG
jgi:hypothetical protein